MDRDGRIVVARVITRLNVGGPTRHVGLLAGGLDRGRFRQVLFHGRTDDGEAEILPAAAGESVRIESLRRSVAPLDDGRAFRALRRAFAKLRPDVVHTHQGKAGALGRIAAGATGASVVHTHHGLAFSGYFGRASAFAYRAIERGLARRSDALIVQSEEQETELRARLGKAADGRIELIRPGVDVAAFLVPASLSRPLGSGSGRVLVPARLVSVKDPALALEVLRLLPPRFTLTFLGDGPLRASLAAEIEGDPAIRGRATIVAPTAEPRDAYASADVVLLTSLSEGTPLALIEAQLAGAAVVAPDVGGVRSVIDAGSGAAVPRSAAALAAAVEFWEARGAARGSRDVVAARFGAARLSADVAALYERLVTAQERLRGVSPR